MTVSRGKMHTYLGMKLDYTTKRQAKITMFDFLDKIIVDFERIEPNHSGSKSSAAPADLFKVDEDCEKRGKTKQEQFHSIVAKTLFATKQARPDTCTPVSFLTSRVRGLDTDDWRKMVHLVPRAVRPSNEKTTTTSERQWKWHTQVVG
jgi:hypothetical protein